MATPQEIPREMKAAVIERFGPPDVVHTMMVPVPKLGKKEILVHVAVAGVGTWDSAFADGSFKEMKIKFPQVLGSDGAGTVVAVGDDVERFMLGDRVYGWGFGNLKGGFFAEYIAIKERDVALIPDSLSFDEAGALAVSGITALQGLEHLGLIAGQSVIIFGASGGLGHVAIQLAKRLDLRVFAVASRDDGVELALRVGADRAVDGYHPMIRDLIAFAPDGFDGALVFAGGRDWKRELATVVHGGTIAWPNGVEPTPAIPKGVMKTPYDGEDSPEAFARLNDLVGRRPFHVELSTVYPLDQTAQALRDVHRHHIGKLAIEIDRL